jgi:hypothetical protein
VLLTLACHINDAGESAYPSIDLLAFETSLSRRAVITHLQNAAAWGWIRTSKHGYGGQRWARNEYDPCIPEDFVPLEMPKVVAPEGGEPNDKKAVNEGNRLADKAVNDVHCVDGKVVNDVPEGGEPNDKKAVNDVHSNRPKELSKEQTTLSSVSSERKKKSNDADDPVFEEAWKAYPKREGDNPKATALKAWRARVRGGVDPQRLLAATKAYADAMRRQGNLGTRYVLHASTFYGPGDRYAAYAPRDDGAAQTDLSSPEDRSSRRLAF